MPSSRSPQQPSIEPTDVDCAVVLFNRDLRVHDHPALAHAVDVAARVVPLFVVEPALLHAPNRTHFLRQCLADLEAGLRRRGGHLVIAVGDPVEEALRTARAHGAQALFTSADVTARARQRAARLEDGCRRARVELATFPGVTVVPAGELTPADGDHYRVFTPYWRRWVHTVHRRPIAAPPRVEVPASLGAPRLPTVLDVRPTSPELPVGGEASGRCAMASWRGLDEYARCHDLLAADGTSRLSPYLHFGCLSPAELAARAAWCEGGEPFLRQLCWRDFHHQVTAAFPDIATAEYHPRGTRWRRDEVALAAWREGCTGYPIVDAGMRQLRREGWMHNRARLITASFLTKVLGLDWRAGAARFMRLLVDGDVANNAGNWQWVAGTGNDPRRNRSFNPLRQATRYDPDGAYVRRYVPELADVPVDAVHQPWTLPPARRRGLDYPAPIVEPRRRAAVPSGAGSG
jgi:deoxyribodipyrimidine photo-lyase